MDLTSILNECWIEGSSISVVHGDLKSRKLQKTKLNGIEVSLVAYEIIDSYFSRVFGNLPGMFAEMFLSYLFYIIVEGTGINLL